MVNTIFYCNYLPLLERYFKDFKSKLLFYFSLLIMALFALFNAIDCSNNEYMLVYAFFILLILHSFYSYLKLSIFFCQKLEILSDKFILEIWKYDKFYEIKEITFEKLNLEIKFHGSRHSYCHMLHFIKKNDVSIYDLTSYNGWSKEKFEEIVVAFEEIKKENEMNGQ